MSQSEPSVSRLAVRQNSATANLASASSRMSRSEPTGGRLAGSQLAAWVAVLRFYSDASTEDRPAALTAKGLKSAVALLGVYSDVARANRPEVSTTTGLNAASDSNLDDSPERDPPLSDGALGEAISSNGRVRSRERRGRCPGRCTLSAGRCASERQSD